MSHSWAHSRAIPISQSRWRIYRKSSSFVFRRSSLFSCVCPTFSHSCLPPADYIQSLLSHPGLVFYLNPSFAGQKIVQVKVWWLWWQILCGSMMGSGLNMIEEGRSGLWCDSKYRGTLSSPLTNCSMMGSPHLNWPVTQRKSSWEGYVGSKRHIWYMTTVLWGEKGYQPQGSALLFLCQYLCKLSTCIIIVPFYQVRTKEQSPLGDSAPAGWWMLPGEREGIA